MNRQLVVAEAAASLRASDWTIRELCRTGKLRAAYIGGKWLIDEEALTEFVQNATPQAAPTRRRRRRSA